MTDAGIYGVRPGVSTSLGRSCRIDPTAVIGYCPPGAELMPVTIGSNVEIGAFCVIEVGAVIGDDVKICHHCVIAVGADVGDRTQLVDSVRVDARARVGRDCIIGGNVADRAVIGDRVTFMGEMSHNYPDATKPWGAIDEISPIINEGAVVAQGAEIIGGIVIGAGSYIVAGEIVRSDVPAETLVAHGKFKPMSRTRGLIQARRTV